MKEKIFKTLVELKHKGRRIIGIAHDRREDG